MNARIDQIVKDIGISAHLSGYDAICLAIERKLKNPKEKMTATYYSVSKIMGCTPTSVERCIRHAIERLFKKGDREKIFNYFGKIPLENNHITNNEFISTLARVIKMEAYYDVYKR